MHGAVYYSVLQRIHLIKKDTAFFVCFYFTSLCPEFCFCQKLPLCSFGAVMPSRKMVIGVSIAESVRQEELVVKVERLFSWLLLEGGTWFWVPCWYTEIPGVLQQLNLTWEIMSSALPREPYIQSQQQEKEETTQVLVLHLHIVTSDLLSPILFPVQS